MQFKPSETSKLKHKKGLWSPDEDRKLRNYILKHGLGSWSSLPVSAGLERNGKSCRLRWINYLRPGLKRGIFTIQEEDAILTLHGMLGNKWSQIAQHLPGRTDNEIKNYWHSYLKKKVAESLNIKDQTRAEYTSSTSSNIESPSSASSLNSSGNPEGSSPDADQFVPRLSNLPKVLFADWLSLDHFQSQEFSNPSQLTVAKQTFQPNSSFQNSIVNGHVVASTISHGLVDESYGDMASRAHPKFEDQSIDTEFLDFISENNMSCDFNIKDLMYI